MSTPTDGVVLSGLVKTYGDVRAVDGVDLRIGAGETVALLGPNGAGKSTTIDMILGLLRPDGGSVTVFGQVPSAAVRAGLVSGMLQTGALVRDVSVGELIRTVGSLYPHPLDAGDVLARTGTAALADRPTHKLSGGQAQRVRFAIALIADPSLLVLDEPTVALDVEGRREFWSAMRGVAATGKTVVFATHYLEEADAYADRIVLMARGRIVADGPSTEIKAAVGQRTVRATLAGVDDGQLAALDGVVAVERHGEAVLLRCTDSDAVLHRLLRDHPETRDIEVRGADLEEAFIELTGDRGSAPTS